jgi:hypothetical protein
MKIEHNDVTGIKLRALLQEKHFTSMPAHPPNKSIDPSNDPGHISLEGSAKIRLYVVEAVIVEPPRGWV